MKTGKYSTDPENLPQLKCFRLVEKEIREGEYDL
jgi:hypothetical protein